MQPAQPKDPPAQPKDHPAQPKDHPAQPNDPLHGVTLKALLTELVDRYGWPGLAERIDIACFKNDPSLGSSLKFLRKTDWARAKVERLYLADKQRAERSRKRNQQRAERRARAVEEGGARSAAATARVSDGSPRAADAPEKPTAQE